MSIGEKIKLLRKVKRMTIRELAIACGVSEPLIAKYERNKIAPPLEKMKILAIALDTDVEYFIMPENDDTSLSYYYELAVIADDELGRSDKTHAASTSRQEVYASIVEKYQGSMGGIEAVREAIKKLGDLVELENEYRGEANDVYRRALMAADELIGVAAAAKRLMQQEVKNDKNPTKH